MASAQYSPQSFLRLNPQKSPYSQRLRKVLASPTTDQYKSQGVRDSPFYKPAFRLSKEQWQKTLLQPWLRRTNPLMPAYPYGKNAHYPEANYGLYGGSTITSGHKISDGRNKGKTLRKWFPNVRMEKVRSEALNKELHIPIRARVMRTIRKVGGLDQYLLSDTPARIKELGLLGWKLRWLVMRTGKYSTPNQTLKVTRVDGGTRQQNVRKPVETFAEAWENEETRMKLLQEQDKAWIKLRDKMDRWEAHAQRQWEAKDKKLPGSEGDPYTVQHPRLKVLDGRLPSEIVGTLGEYQERVKRIQLAKDRGQQYAVQREVEQQAAQQQQEAQQQQASPT